MYLLIPGISTGSNRFSTDLFSLFCLHISLLHLIFGFIRYVHVIWLVVIFIIQGNSREHSSDVIACFEILLYQSEPQDALSKRLAIPPTQRQPLLSHNSIMSSTSTLIPVLNDLFRVACENRFSIDDSWPLDVNHITQILNEVSTSQSEDMSRLQELLSKQTEAIFASRMCQTTSDERSAHTRDPASDRAMFEDHPQYLANLHVPKDLLDLSVKAFLELMSLALAPS
jgi:hypothetical protein